MGRNPSPAMSKHDALDLERLHMGVARIHVRLEEFPPGGMMFLKASFARPVSHDMKLHGIGCRCKCPPPVLRK